MESLSWFFGRKKNEDVEDILTSLDVTISGIQDKKDGFLSKAQFANEKVKMELERGNRDRAKSALELRNKYLEAGNKLDDHIYALETQRANLLLTRASNAVYGCFSLAREDWAKQNLNLEEVKLLVADHEEQKSITDQVNQLLEPVAVLNLEDELSLELREIEESMDKEEQDLRQSSRRDTHAAAEQVPVALSHDESSQPGTIANKAIHEKADVVSRVNSSRDNRPIHEKKSNVYADVVKKLNSSREQGLPFRPAVSFKVAYESLGIDLAPGKSVDVQKLWQLIQAMTGEDSAVQEGVSKRMSLVIGALRHLECGHQKHVMDTIQRDPIQAAFDESVGNLQRIRGFLRIRLRNHGIRNGVLDFDFRGGYMKRIIDTTWEQIYFCLRTGYYEEALQVAQSSRSSQRVDFAQMLKEWITTRGNVITTGFAFEKVENIFRLPQSVRNRYEKMLLLYAMISGSRRQIDRIWRNYPKIFDTIEDFMWFRLACIRDTVVSPSVVFDDGITPYRLEDLQAYLNKFEPSHYTKQGTDPLVYPYVLLLSIQLVPAIVYMFKEAGDEGFNIDAIHIAISLVDHSLLSEGSGTGHKLSVMDANAEASRMIREYGSMYLHQDDLQMALEYYTQAAIAVGGGQVAWSGRSNDDQQTQRNLMLKQLLTEILLREGGISFLLGTRGSSAKGELVRFLPDSNLRQQFLIEAAPHFLEAGVYDKIADFLGSSF